MNKQSLAYTLYLVCSGLAACAVFVYGALADNLSAQLSGSTLMIMTWIALKLPESK